MPEASPDSAKAKLTEARAAKIKSYATLIAAVGGFLTAIGAYFKPQDHHVTQVSYETLSAGMTKLSDDVKQNHDDLVALRGYLDGIVMADGLGPMPVTGVPAPTSSPSVSPSPAPSYSPAPSVSSSASALPHKWTSLHWPKKEPPQVHGEPEKWEAPPFSAVQKK